MSATATDAPATLPPHRITAATLRRIADDAFDVDRVATDLRPQLRALGEDASLDLGLDGADGSLSDQAAVIACLAGESIVSAFTVWAHRMTLDYLTRAPRGPLDDVVGDLRTGRRPGVSAMAAAFSSAQSTASPPPLPVRFTRDGDSLLLDGVIRWASNLYDDAQVVTAAEQPAARDSPRRRVVVTFPLDTPGITVRPADPLVALDSSRSGSILLDGLRIPADHVIDDDFSSFVAAVKPTFLLLQSAFCLGLAGASIGALDTLAGPTEVFAPDVASLQDEHASLTATLVDLAGSSQPSRRLACVQLRLDAALLAGRATRLELCCTGGRGYVATSTTARRVREALFLPIQSPTESDLRWELQ